MSECDHTGTALCACGVSIDVDNTVRTAFAEGARMSYIDHLEQRNAELRATVSAMADKLKAVKATLASMVAAIKQAPRNPETN